MNPYNRKTGNAPSLPGRQGGYALMIGLILVLVLSILGVYAMIGSVMEERMAGNTRDNRVAFEAREMTLRWGEAWVQSRRPISRPFPCQTLTQDDSAQNCANPRQVLAANLLAYNLEDLDPWGSGDDWSNARAYGIDPATNQATVPARSVPGVKAQPQFIIEQTFIDRDDLAGNPYQGRVFYRIVAAGKGARDYTVSVGESSVAKRYE